MYWVSWERMCWPKSKGGLGFKIIAAFNRATLTKKGWKLIMDSDSLLARTLKARYFSSMYFMEARLGYGPSFI